MKFCFHNGNGHNFHNGNITWSLVCLCSRVYYKDLIDINSFSPHNNPMLYEVATDGRTQARKVI